MEVTTRFSLGDTVWALKKGKAISFEIKSISVGVSTSEDFGNYVFYNSDEGGAVGTSLEDKEVFASKEDLKNSIFGTTEDGL